MEQFLLDNAERYRKLVAALKPPKTDSKGAATTAASPEIIVSARVRPMLEDELSQGFPIGIYPRGGDSTIIDVHELYQPVRGLPKLRSFNYEVDKVFGPDSSTAEVYESLVKPLVPWAWDGGIGTMFAYGQTASGKTLTITGVEEHVAETLMDGSLDGERKLFISIIELAGQTAYDLLNSRNQISILEDSFGTIQLAGALEHHVTTKEALLGYIEAAASLRRSAPTLKNDNSSRSHSICRIRFENPALPSADDGMLYLIDLAGSEAARDKTDHDASRMKEAREINTSLSVLKDSIRGRALADADAFSGIVSKKPGYIPFRQSTLTKTLKHVFDPSCSRSCKTIVVACINPCLADLGASKNTLRYAEMLRVLVPRNRPTEYDADAPATWNNEQLRSWIERNALTPPITPSLLAPSESGEQLLRLPIPYFILRCMKTDNVSSAQAHAFHSKLWKLHISSQRRRAAASKPASAARSGPAPAKGPGPAAAMLSRVERLDSSADPDPEAADVPFRQRIRPGMVIRWTPPAEYASLSAGTDSYAMVMCPAQAVGQAARDVRGAPVNPPAEGRAADGEAYLCAMVLPAALPGFYGINVWRHVVVRVEEMADEVLMVWDEASRYYCLTV